MNALTTTAPGGALITENDAGLLRVMRDSLYPGARPESVKMVLAYCRARNLDPMLKPVHIVPMPVKINGRYDMVDVPLPGIGLYRIQAARSGVYGGKTEPEFGPDVTRKLDGLEVTFPQWCKITVYRGDKAFTAREMWMENYATAGRDTAKPNSMWAKRPYGQLAKCAEAQALRMAFPEAVGSEPTAEEMEGKTMRDVPNLAQPAPTGPLAEMQPPADEVLYMIDNDGVARDIRASKTNPAIMIWMAACRKAIGKLESPEAVRGWRQEMGPHFAEIADSYPDEVRAVEELCDARTQPEEEPRDAG